MKRIAILLMTLAVTFSLIGCGSNKNSAFDIMGNGKLTTPNTMEETFPIMTGPAIPEATEPAATEMTRPAPTEATAPETVPPVTQPVETTPKQTPGEVPYTRKISDPEYPIWNGPGYEYSRVDTVREAGIYTIVEEKRDGAGNLWGRLKSGVGWVDLTALERGFNLPELTVEEVDPWQISQIDVHYCVADTSEYAITIALRVSQDVSDVRFYQLDCVNDYGVLEQHYQITYWDSTKALVAQVAFPGDMSSYGICFTDTRGYTWYYGITQSGLDGSVVLFSYEP